MYSITVSAIQSVLSHFQSFFLITDSSQLDVVVPKDLAEQLNGALRDGAGTLRYARVNMKLSELIEGDFFNHYIKTGLTVLSSL